MAALILSALGAATRAGAQGNPGARPPVGAGPGPLDQPSGEAAGRTPQQLPPALPGAGEPAMGPAPGAGGQPGEGRGPAGGGYLGGGAGLSTGRIPGTLARPYNEPPPPPFGPLPGVPRAVFPRDLSLELPTAADEGPPDGLTLDAAIARMLALNDELRARFLEIPKADADILTAGLRANPALYFDTQFIPYGRFAPNANGGPTQYDLNVTYPLDVTRKRQARLAVACRAKRVIEAQYQDAVRLQIDNLYTAFADALAAREEAHYSRASLARLEEAQRQARRRRGGVDPADLEDLRRQIAAAAFGLAEGEQTLLDAKRALAVLIVVPPEAADQISLRGSLRPPAAHAPPDADLIRVALADRPDLAAFRLGVLRAQADVNLARANRYQNVFLLYQPFTAQTGTAPGQGTAHSWAVGATVPLPLFDRNQGNIQRARINVAQTRAELIGLERRVAAEVQRAARSYADSDAAVDRYEHGLLNEARRRRDDAFSAYLAGRGKLGPYVEAQKDYREVVDRYLDLLVRRRRALLKLNTALGRRAFP